MLEFVVRDVFQRHTGEDPGTRPLENLLQRLVKDGHLPKRVSAYANAVRELGNVGTHAYGEAITKADVAQSLAQLTVILEWYFEHERPPERANAPAETPDRGSLPAEAGPGASVPPPKPPRRRILVFAVPIALTLCVLLALSALVLPPVRAWLHPPAAPNDGRPAPQPPATPTAYKGDIDVIVYDPKNPRRQNVRIDAPDVLPLKPGDGIAVEAEINPPAYLYIVWIDADGSVDPVYPWKPGHWEDRPAQEQPVTRLRRPEDSFFPMGPSTPGMETLVLLARETALPADVDLRAELGQVRPQASQTLQAMAWFENGAVVKNEPGRKPMWDEKLDDPVGATQEQVRTRLGSLFPYTRAVSFAVRGK